MPIKQINGIWTNVGTDEEYGPQPDFNNLVQAQTSTYQPKPGDPDYTSSQQQDPLAAAKDYLQNWNQSSLGRTFNTHPSHPLADAIRTTQGGDSFAGLNDEDLEAQWIQHHGAEPTTWSGGFAKQVGKSLGEGLSAYPAATVTLGGILGGPVGAGGGALLAGLGSKAAQEDPTAGPTVGQLAGDTALTTLVGAGTDIGAQKLAGALPGAGTKLGQLFGGGKLTGLGGAALGGYEGYKYGGPLGGLAGAAGGYNLGAKLPGSRLAKTLGDMLGSEGGEAAAAGAETAAKAAPVPPTATAEGVPLGPSTGKPGYYPPGPSSAPPPTPSGLAEAVKQVRTPPVAAPPPPPAPPDLMDLFQAQQDAEVMRPKPWPEAGGTAVTNPVTKSTGIVPTAQPLSQIMPEAEYQQYVNATPQPPVTPDSVAAAKLAASGERQAAGGSVVSDVPPSAAPPTPGEAGKAYRAAKGTPGEAAARKNALQAWFERAMNARDASQAAPATTPSAPRPQFSQQHQDYLDAAQELQRQGKATPQALSDLAKLLGLQ